VIVVFQDVSAARARSQQMTHSAQTRCGYESSQSMAHEALQSISWLRQHDPGVLFLDLDVQVHHDSLGHAGGDPNSSVHGKRWGQRSQFDNVSRQGGDGTLYPASEISPGRRGHQRQGKLTSFVTAPHSMRHDLDIAGSIGISSTMYFF